MRLRHPPFIFVKNIKRWQAKFRFWPPKDASPVQPIEPWGKQFFVYNGRPKVELKGDPRRPDEDISRPKWLRDEIALSLLRPGENPNDFIVATHEKDLTPEEADENAEFQVETVLCITDFRRRPLCYLSPDEFKSLMDNLPAVKRAMEEYKAKIPSTRVDNVDELQRLYHPDRRYKKAGGKGQVLIPYHRHGEQIMPLNIPNHKLGPYKEWYKQAKPDRTLYH